MENQEADTWPHIPTQVKRARIRGRERYVQWCLNETEIKTETNNVLALALFLLLDSKDHGPLFNVR